MTDVVRLIINSMVYFSITNPQEVCLVNLRDRGITDKGLDTNNADGWRGGGVACEVLPLIKGGVEKI